MGSGGLVSAERLLRVGQLNGKEDRNLDLGEVASGLCAKLLHYRQVFDQAVGRHGQRRPSVAERGSVPQRAQVVGRDSASSDMDWRMGFLPRLGQASNRRKANELALEAGFLFAPELLHRADILSR